MANTPLYAHVGHDSKYGLQITVDGVPKDITNFNAEFYLKPSSEDDDAEASVYSAGYGLTVVDATLGMVDVTVPADDIGTVQDILWYHLDVVDPLNAENRGEAMFGLFCVNP
jgi:hypothetical protein